MFAIFTSLLTWQTLSLVPRNSVKKKPEIEKKEKEKKELWNLANVNHLTTLFQQMLIQPYQKELDQKSLSQIRFSILPLLHKHKFHLWTAEYERDHFAPRPLLAADLEIMFPLKTKADKTDKEIYLRGLTLARRTKHVVFLKNIGSRGILFTPRGCCFSIQEEIGSGTYKKFFRVNEVLPPDIHPPARSYALSESTWNINSGDKILTTSSHDEHIHNLLKGPEVTNFYLSYRCLEQHEKEVEEKGIKSKTISYYLKEFTLTEYARYSSIFSVMQNLNKNHWIYLFGSKNRGIKKFIKTSCEILNKMHKLQLLHRDINPKNMVVSEDEESGANCVKWVDFGSVSRFGDQEQLIEWRTTCLYISPELASEGLSQFAKRQPPTDYASMSYIGYQNEKLDIWSLGITILEVSFGSAQALFDLFGIKELTVEKVLQGIVTFDPERAISELDLRVDETIKQVLRFTLVVDPVRRPNAQELLDTVNELFTKEEELVEI